MGVIDSLLQASPSEVVQIMVGVIAGVVIVAAVVLVPFFRNLLVVSLALLIIGVVLVDGLPGLVKYADVIFRHIKEHEQIVKGLLIGKLLAGICSYMQRGNAP